MIERHSKVFVPVSNDKQEQGRWTLIKLKGENGLLLEEKENVYVLSEQELNMLIIEKLKSLELVSITEDGSMIYSPIK